MDEKKTMTMGGATFPVLDAGDPDFAAKFADAIGVKPGDSIELVMPQFTRTPDMPPPPALPATDEEWRDLWQATPEALKERGFGNWDGGLFLLPGEWFGHVPGWFEVECINGGTSRWDAEARDDDTRMGCLAFGVRVGPATDGEG